MKRIKSLEATKYTTGFSNIGKIDLPEAILSRVDYMEFFISLDEEIPYYFSCITAGDTLTITFTLKVNHHILIQTLDKNLMPFKR